MIINNATGEISGTLSNAAAGTHNLIVTVNDGNGGVVNTNFLWLVTIAGSGEGLSLESLVVSSVSSSDWTLVSVSNSYIEPVVACSIRYSNNTIPQVVRMRNALTTSFEIQLQNPSNQSLSSETVDCLIVEAGSWTLADGKIGRASGRERV